MSANANRLRCCHPMVYFDIHHRPNHTGGLVVRITCVVLLMGDISVAVYVLPLLAAIRLNPFLSGTYRSTAVDIFIYAHICNRIKWCESIMLCLVLYIIYYQCQWLQYLIPRFMVSYLYQCTFIIIWLCFFMLSLVKWIVLIF